MGEPTLEAIIPPCRYEFSSTYIDGNPTGFQKWVKADNTRGILRKKKYECNIFSPVILMLNSVDPSFL